MIKKLSDKDIKDWENFLNSKDKIENKDKSFLNNPRSYKEKSIDLHGYTLEEANNKMYELINQCYLENVNKINVITGKGLRSKNTNDPYQSSDLSILKHSVPDFIKNNPELNQKILKIDFKSVNSPSKGSFDIFLKKK